MLALILWLIILNQTAKLYISCSLKHQSIGSSLMDKRQINFPIVKHHLNQTSLTLFYLVCLQNINIRLEFILIKILLVYYRIRRCLVPPKQPMLPQIREETRQRWFLFFFNFSTFIPKVQLKGCFMITSSYLNRKKTKIRISSSY